MLLSRTADRPTRDGMFLWCRMLFRSTIIYGILLLKNEFNKINQRYKRSSLFGDHIILPTNYRVKYARYPAQINNSFNPRHASSHAFATRTNFYPIPLISKARLHTILHPSITSSASKFTWVIASREHDALEHYYDVISTACTNARKFNSSPYYEPLTHGQD